MYIHNEYSDVYMLSVRVDEGLQKRMKKYPSINWSKFIRESIEERIRMEEMMEASRVMDELARKTPKDWSGVDEIRKWRDRRRG